MERSICLNLSQFVSICIHLSPPEDTGLADLFVFICHRLRTPAWLICINLSPFVSICHRLRTPGWLIYLN